MGAEDYAPLIVQELGELVVHVVGVQQREAHARAILDNAASAYQTCGQAQVMIAGHADKSGSDQYNVGLSQRRAANVRSYLAGRGIPDGVMTTEAFGESRPLAFVNLAELSELRGWSEDDGRLRLIDWEYSGVGQRLFDLASVCVYHKYDKLQREQLR